MAWYGLARPRRTVLLVLLLIMSVNITPNTGLTLENSDRDLFMLVRYPHI
jgi:hypothetical protein